MCGYTTYAIREWDDSVDIVQAAQSGPDMIVVYSNGEAQRVPVTYFVLNMSARRATAGEAINYSREAATLLN